MNKRFRLRIVLAWVMFSFVPLALSTENEGQPSEPESSKQAEQPSAFEYLQLMQHAYQNGHYEMLYLSSLQQQLEPMQLIHSLVDGVEVSYFRYLNGVIRESLQSAGKISYFEQGRPAYTLETKYNHSVFSNIANYDFEKGRESYDYIILGKGRIAGKQSIAIRMIGKDEYRYSYVIWCDLESGLPLRLDTLNKDSLVVEQVMVVSLKVTAESNPWLVKLTQSSLPEIVHIQQSTTDKSSKWKPNWLPTGFSVIKDDQHTLIMHDNEPVSYILLDDGISNVSIYISKKKIVLNEQQKLIRQGATILYTEQRGKIEINVVGNIPVATAKRLASTIVLANDDYRNR